MYQGTGEPKKNFKVQSQVHKFKYNQGTSVMTLNVRCQSFTVEIKFKCDDLVDQVSITNSGHYQLLVLIVLYQSTINPQVGLNYTEKIESQLFQRTITILELPGFVSSPTTFPNHATLDASEWCIRCNGAH